MKSTSSTKKGIILSTILIIVSIICYYGFNLPENGKSQYLILSIYLLGIIWVLLTVDHSLKPYRLRDYFSEGFKAFIVVTLLMTVYTFIFHKINPQIMEKGISDNNALLYEEGNKTTHEIEENAEKLRSIFIPMMLMISTISYLILGALITLVTAGFLSQKNNSIKK